MKERIIGERIRELRMKAKISQRKLGEILGGYDKATISRWERNENDPPINDIKKMAEYFGVSPAYILGISDDMHFDLKTIKNALQKKETVLLWDGRPLPDEDRVYLKRILDPILERIISPGDDEDD